jgi:hypothetical protein
MRSMATQGLFTLPEVASVLGVDRRRLDRLAKIGAVLPCYQPAAAGDSSLYTLGDVVLVMVLQRLELEGVSYAGRVAFAARFGGVVRAIAERPDSGASAMVVSDRFGPRVVERASGAESYSVRFLIAPIVADVRGRAAALRADKFGEVWSGWRRRAVETVAQELAHVHGPRP